MARARSPSHQPCEAAMGVMTATAFAAVLVLASIASAAHPHARNLRAAGLKSQLSQLPAEVCG